MSVNKVLIKAVFFYLFWTYVVKNECVKNNGSQGPEEAGDV